MAGFKTGCSLGVQQPSARGRPEVAGSVSAIEGLLQTESGCRDFKSARSKPAVEINRLSVCIPKHGFSGPNLVDVVN